LIVKLNDYFTVPPERVDASREILVYFTSFILLHFYLFMLSRRITGNRRQELLFGQHTHSITVVMVSIL